MDGHNIETTTDDVRDMLFFAVDIDQGQPVTRTEAANLARIFNRLSKANPVVLLIRQGTTIALALCERTDYQQQWRTGQKLGKVRILMNTNCREPHRGHVDILAALASRQCSTFDAVYDHWLDTLSVSNLNKQFYRRLQDWYFVAVQQAQFPNDITRADDYQAHNEEAIIRLITRFIFVWFLKQKDLVNDDIFDTDKLAALLRDFDPQSEQSGNFYNAIAQNLFFATLNRKIEERKFVVSYQGKSEEHDVKSFYRCRDLFANGLDDNTILALFRQTPYVNGSLFDCLDNYHDKDDGHTYSYDGFSNSRTDQNGIIKRAFVPNRLFFAPEDSIEAQISFNDDGKSHTQTVRATGLITLFRLYYFTVEENTPLEEQIALDPELLGRVFENLLGAYNPETQQTARNATGSFYTPREIVEYMVDESLRAYLGLKCPDCTHTVDALFDTVDEAIDTNHTQPILQALYHCRILDPACGSGAFPMGMLQRMVELLRRLDPGNTAWRKIVEDEAANPDYTRKLYLIRNSIHGVDLQNIAIMIAKLRFFISLLCEQQADNDADNYGIFTLPNLETNLVCANSLIAADFSTEELNDIARLKDDEELNSLRDELKKVRDEHFTAKSKDDKQQLEEQDKQLREQIKQHIIDTYRNPLQHNIDMWQQGIAEYQKIIDTHQGSKIELRDEAVQTSLFDDVDTPRRKRRVDINLEARNKAEVSIKANQQSIRQAEARIQRLTAGAQHLAGWNPYDPIKSSPFFDTEWMFGIATGFDIVIGNPPYIRLEKDGGKLGKLYKDKGYATFARKGDIYCLFYERGLQLCAKDAFTCFITSNKWMRAGYGEATRKFLAEHNPRLLVDFGGLQVFESATVDTNILLVQNAPPAGDTLCCTVKGTKSLKTFDLSGYVRDNASPQAFTTSGAWTILSAVEQAIKAKIEAAGVPLKGWKVSINYGIKTGFNDAFIITTERRDEILSHCKSKAERARTEKLIRKVLRGRDIRRYGYQWAGLWLINTHNGVREKGIPRVDIEDYPAVKAHLDSFGGKLAKRQDQGDTPYNLRNCAYLQDFDKPKIVYAEIGTAMNACFVEAGMYVNNKCYLIVGDNLEFLLGYFNSKLFDKLIFSSANITGGKGTGFLSEVPIPRATPDEQKPIVELVRQVLAAKSKGEDTTTLERTIDRLVCDLYGLTDAERAAIGFVEIK